MLASLNHPGIATLYSFEEIHGIPSSSSRHVLTMEFVEGEPLSKRMKAGTIPMGEALSIGRDIAAALEAAHAKGIVHRDLKPGNVMVSSEGRVKLLDFGLAKSFEKEPAPVDLSHSPTLTAAGTETGVILGTAAYMSPEQARGQRVDARTDVWAFGVVLWELLTGRRLFGGHTTPDTLAAVLREPVDFKALPPSTPREVRDLLARCLERDPEKRLANIGEARRVLEEAEPGGGISRAVGMRLAAVVGLLLLVAAGGVFLVVAALKVKLLPGKAAGKHHSPSSEAYELYLLGRDLYSRGAASELPRARELLRKAVKLDPAYAPGWATLAAAEYSVADMAKTPGEIDGARKELFRWPRRPSRSTRISRTATRCEAVFARTSGTGPGRRRTWTAPSRSTPAAVWNTS